MNGHGDIGIAVTAIKEGAVDLVQKPYHEQQLLDAINEALRRDAVNARARRKRTPSDRLAGASSDIDSAQREVVDLALKGLRSRATIARQLSISHRTVEQHRSRLLEKLGVGSMNESLRLTLDRLSR